MKKEYSIAFSYFVVGLIATSCLGTEALDVNEQEQMSFVAVQESNSTKTVIATDNTIINWEESDVIALFDSESKKELVISTGSGTSEAIFEGKVTKSDSYLALFPSQGASMLSGKSVATSLPSEQVAVDNSFDSSAHLMIAYTSSNLLTFMNAVSFVAVRPEFDCNKIVFSANGNELLAGDVSVSYNSGSPITTVTGSGSSSVILTGDIKANKMYYIAVCPQVLSNGFAIEFNSLEGLRSTRSTANCVSLIRSHVLDLGNFSKDGIWTQQIIVFKDSAVHDICVNRWDSDGDGELSFVEAASVTELPYDVFFENTSITSFDEFQFFVNCSTIKSQKETVSDDTDFNGAFEGCTSLSSIILPESLKTIGYSAFSGCTSLSEITIPASVNQIRDLAFAGDPQLEVHMKSEEPVSLIKHSFSNSYYYSFGYAGAKVKAIYVPTFQSEQAYRNSTFYELYRFIIHLEGYGSIPEVPYVDLELPSGTKWATMNLGATDIADPGNYYSWGEISPRSTYSWAGYKYGGYNKIEKYDTIDHLSILDPEDDAATMAFGSGWRIPTRADWDELISNTSQGKGVSNTFSFTRTLDGQSHSVFFPLSGYIQGNTVYTEAATEMSSGDARVRRIGHYWTSNGYGNTARTYVLKYQPETNKSHYSTEDLERPYGRTIRAVYSEDPKWGITGLSLDKTAITVEVGQSESLTYQISANPSALNKQVRWVSSDSSVASVSYGVVTGVSAGTATIFAKTISDGFIATCKVTVTSPEE